MTDMEMLSIYEYEMKQEQERIKRLNEYRKYEIQSKVLDTLQYYKKTNSFTIDPETSCLEYILLLNFGTEESWICRAVMAMPSYFPEFPTMNCNEFLEMVRTISDEIEDLLDQYPNISLYDLEIS